MKSKSKKTAYGVYIVECLRAGDFNDGKVLHQILELMGMVSVYQNAKTIEDFRSFIEDFKTSQFRYLHISCHADKKGLEIDGEDFSNEALQDLLKGGLKNKRVFMSACQGANKDLASRLLVDCEAYSLIGTPVDLDFDKSVLFWPSFYHIINEYDQQKMKRDFLIETLQKCVDMFGVPINYYSKIKNTTTHLRRLKVRRGVAIDNQKISSRN